MSTSLSNTVSSYPAATPSPVAAAALGYVHRGWCPIPVPHRQKKPNFGGWQKTHIAESEVPGYFNGTPKNIGLLLGEPSGGLIDVDHDCPEAVLLGAPMLPSTGFVFGRPGKPASHRFYLCQPVPATAQYVDIDGAMMIELRSTGAQTVVPPSIHPSGEAIEFIAGASEPESVDGPFLAATVARLAAACILARHSPPAGSRHEFRNALAGGLTRAGWDVDDVAAFVRNVCFAARHEDLDDAETAARTSCERHRLGGRFTGWSTLIKLMGESGKAVVSKAAAWLGVRPDDGQTDPVPCDTPVLPPPQPKTIRELIQVFPTLREPVIHGLLRRGETMNVIAPPKFGKSWLVTDLAIAVATGRPWLDTYLTEPGDVLILDNELHGETSAHRVPMVGEARQVPFAEYAERLLVENLRGQLRDVFTLGSYFAALEPDRFRLIVLDAFYRFLPPDMDENDNGTMSQLYNRLDSYAARLGCSFVLIHHASKGNQSAKSVTDVGAGAGSQSRATDTHLVLRQHEEDGVVVMDAAVRSWPPLDPMCLRWSFPVWTPEPGLNPSLLRQEGRRKRRDDEQAADHSKTAWSVELFVGRFLDKAGKTKDEILVEAQAAQLSDRKAEQFLGAAVAKNMAFKWSLGRAVKEKYATEREPALPHLPEVPKSRGNRRKR